MNVPQPRLLWEFNDNLESISRESRYSLIIRNDYYPSTNTPIISNGVLTCDGQHDFMQMAQNIDFTLTSYSMEVKLNLHHF